MAIGEQLEVLAEAMGDHGANLQSSHSDMDEIPNAAATRAEQMDEIVRMFIQLGAVLDEVTQSIEEDEKKVDSGIVTISRESDEIGSTVDQVHATLDEATNPTATLAEGTAEISRTSVGKGIESLKLSRGGAAEALDKLAMLRSAVDVLGATVLVVKDEVVEMGAFAIEALDDLRYAADNAKTSGELLEQYRQNI
jgi:hypothetical protein